jgi:hypothetical protein
VLKAGDVITSVDGTTVTSNLICFNEFNLFKEDSKGLWPTK